MCEGRVRERAGAAGALTRSVAARLRLCAALPLSNPCSLTVGLAQGDEQLVAGDGDDGHGVRRAGTWRAPAQKEKERVRDPG